MCVSFITTSVCVSIICLMVTLLSNHTFIMIELVFQVLWMLDQIVMYKLFVIRNHIKCVDQVLL